MTGGGTKEKNGEIVMSLVLSEPGCLLADVSLPTMPASKQPTSKSSKVSNSSILSYVYFLILKMEKGKVGRRNIFKGQPGVVVVVVVFTKGVGEEGKQQKALHEVNKQ